MTLYDYWAILRRSWVLIVAAAAAGAFLGLVLSLLQASVYQANTQLFVNVKTEGGLGSAYSGGLFVQQRVKSYVDVVDSPGVLEPVIQELGLDMTPAQLAGKVSASTPPNTVLVTVSVTDGDPEQATQIANAVATSFSREIAALEGSEPSVTPTPTPTSGAATPTSPTSTVQATVIKPAAGAGKVAPQPRINVLLGGLVGLLLGIGFAILRHTLDTTIKTPEELEEVSGSTTLGAITYDPDASSSPLVTLRDTPRSEAFRTVRTNLQYVNVDQPPQAVVITSSLPSEGKSTTSCNIAIALSQAGARVLLVEADLRKPKVAEYLQVDGSRGLTDVLVGRLSLSQAIVRWRRGILDFMPAGSIPPNPSELLGSKHMARLLKELRTRYDIIIFDTPPLLPVTDAAVLSTIADGAILVARYGQTRRDEVEAARDALAQVNARLLGSVLNFVPMSKKGYGYKYGYGYGYGYGYEDKARTSQQPAVKGPATVAVNARPAPPTQLPAAPQPLPQPPGPQSPVPQMPRR